MPELPPGHKYVSVAAGSFPSAEQIRVHLHVGRAPLIASGLLEQRLNERGAEGSAADLVKLEEVAKHFQYSLAITVRLFF